MATIQTVEEKPVDLSQILKEIVFQLKGVSHTLEEIVEILKYNHKYRITFTFDDLAAVLNNHLQNTGNDLQLALIIVHETYLGLIDSYKIKFRRI